MGAEFNVSKPEVAAKFSTYIRSAISGGGNNQCPKIHAAEKYKFHSQPPKGTLYIEVHGFVLQRNCEFIVCSCFKKGCELIVLNRGDITESYAGVLFPLESVAIILTKLKYVPLPNSGEAFVSGVSNNKSSTFLREARHQGSDDHHPTYHRCTVSNHQFTTAADHTPCPQCL